MFAPTLDAAVATPDNTELSLTKFATMADCRALMVLMPPANCPKVKFLVTVLPPDFSMAIVNVSLACATAATDSDSLVNCVTSACASVVMAVNSKSLLAFSVIVMVSLPMSAVTSDTASTAVSILSGLRDGRLRGHVDRDRAAVQREHRVVVHVVLDGGRVGSLFHDVIVWRIRDRQLERLHQRLEYSSASLALVGLLDRNCSRT